MILQLALVATQPYQIPDFASLSRAKTFLLAWHGVPQVYYRHHYGSVGKSRNGAMAYSVCRRHRSFFALARTRDQL